MDFKGIVAGLGNPGTKYEKTRHNCGFMFIIALLKHAEQDGKVEELNGKKFNGLLWSVTTRELNGKWLAVMPQTFMNDSGTCLQPLMTWYKMPPDKLLVVHDELDIPPGELRFKYDGGLAGHNGLASISARLGTNDYYRLRIGIGKPADKENMISWVLGRPANAAARLMEEIVPEALQTFFIFSRDGEKAAAQYARDVSRQNRVI